jgi:hypothetical protein
MLICLVIWNIVCVLIGWYYCVDINYNKIFIIETFDAFSYATNQYKGRQPAKYEIAIIN